MMTSLLLMKAMLLAGMGLWLLVASTNNLIDPQTNRYLLQQMISMTALRQETLPLGQGLLWRSLAKPRIAAVLLYLIVAWQLVTAGWLLKAGSALFLGGYWNHADQIAQGIQLGNTALLLFNSLWLFFLIGGLWFGYWLKFSTAQTVHLFLLCIGMMMFIMINLH